MNRITYEEIEKLADDNEVVVKHCQDDICEVNWKTAGIGFTGQFDSENKGIYGIHSDPDDAKALLELLAHNSKLFLDLLGHEVPKPEAKQ